MHVFQTKISQSEHLSNSQYLMELSNVIDDMFRHICISNRCTCNKFKVNLKETCDRVNGSLESIVRQYIRVITLRKLLIYGWRRRLLSIILTFYNVDRVLLEDGIVEEAPVCFI